MITEIKGKKDWKYEKLTFPKGYTPSSAKWRTSEHGLRYVWVDRIIKDGDNYDTFELDEKEIKTDARGRQHLTGWVLQEESAYQYDRGTATF